MDMDTTMERVSLITSSNDIKTINFSLPAHSQVLNVVNVFSSNCYGSMLLDVNVKMAG